jgi:hypothetical protein
MAYRQEMLQKNLTVETNTYAAIKETNKKHIGSEDLTN